MVIYMINILSIDVDWIMEPSIESYNSKTLETQEDTWKNILLAAPKVNYPADARKYNRLVELLFSSSNKVSKENIYLADSHEEIIKAINQWNIRDEFSIYNIDHHHDCGYNITEEKLEDDLNKLTCANWVVYLRNKNSNFVQYTWINNNNSITLLPEAYIPYIPNFSSNISLGILEDIKFDYIFICKSYIWIPPEHRPLIESLYFSLKQYYQIGGNYE